MAGRAASTEDRELGRRQTSGWLVHGFRAGRGVLLGGLDCGCIVGSFLIAYWVRFHWQFLAFKRVGIPGVGDYWKGAILFAGIWVFLVWRDGGYTTGLRGLSAPVTRMLRLLVSGAYATGLMMVIAYLYRELLLSRQVYLTSAVLALVLMGVTRLVLQLVDGWLRSRGMALHRLVVIGMDAQAAEFHRCLGQTGEGARILGFLRWAADEEPGREAFVGCPVLGSLEDVQEIRRHTGFDTLILSYAFTGYLKEERFNEVMLSLVNFCEAEQVALYMLPASFDVAIARHEVGSLAGVPLVRLQDASLHPGWRYFKRAVDLVVSATGIVLGMPLWLLIALAVKLTSRGPVFFTQERIGLHGKPFMISKFRTMQADAADRLAELVDIDHLEVPGFKLKGDPRVSGFLGRVLRRTGLDEIPQLLNVLKGEMSLVGPRPEMSVFVKRYSPAQRRRLKAKPGITGYQQVMARGKPLAACIKYDLIYLKHQGPLFDLYILLRTAWVILFDEGVCY